MREAPGENIGDRNTREASPGPHDAKGDSLLPNEPFVHQQYYRAVQQDAADCVKGTLCQYQLPDMIRKGRRDQAKSQNRKSNARAPTSKGRPPLQSDEAGAGAEVHDALKKVI